ncbi:uncharacterized protein At5g41620-like isoform X2 [Hibiscus syriacus]|uniref:uncharacterized protein At5g41620-like isoform X2 n=1 Tax=Hibiscus syriacus TaxID=106335 RepID=UPI00192308A9|nr:uncharacterized protein At5g41620-like isoform X2 [Hibiscus syriacus]
MSWQPQQNGEGKGKRLCKIRKRGCSSSSSSSLIQKYRFKRAVLAASTKSPSLAIPSAEFPTTEASVYARKLAATLWEINKISSLPGKEELEKKDRRRKAPRVLKMAHTLPPSLFDPSYSPISEKTGRSRIESHKRRSSVVSHKLELSDYKLGSSDFVGNASLIETETHSKGKNHAGCLSGTETRLKDIRNGLTTSKELLKVLNHVCGLEERHSSTMSLISALRIELDRARTGVDRLIREPCSYCDEMEHLMRHFAEEKAAWKRKERDRIRDAIACVADELEVEKKLRRQTERLNKKLGKELADTKASLSKATKEFQGEKRAKEILEQVCDEFAKGIGEDRAMAEELKRETAKVREEVEKEREMLQFADVLREERVQMKLSEAKHQFEEKTAVVEKLRNELEAYLGTKINEENVNGSPNLQKIKELEVYLKNIDFGMCRAAKKDVDKGEVMVNGGEECEADDSADSDLHSIELIMDNNDKSYKRSYACGNHVNGESKRIPIGKENKGMKSRSEELSWGSICLERGSSDSTDWDHEDEIRRYRSVKSLRDHILSSNKRAPIGSFSSPTWQWSNGSPALNRDDSKQWPKVVSAGCEGQTSTS